jgi:CPA1 family monovalent cation:H+ antiporter
VVSLAAALAIPFTIAGGQPFPQRDLIQFVTFGVIIITLVGLGLTLPLVLRWLGLADAGRDEQRREREAEFAARRQTAEMARRRLDELTDHHGVSGEALALIQSRYDARLALTPRSLTDGIEVARGREQLRLDLIEEERQLIHALLREGKINDETRRRIERDLDLEEVAIRTRSGSDDAPL